MEALNKEEFELLKTVAGLIELGGTSCMINLFEVPEDFAKDYGVIIDDTCKIYELKMGGSKIVFYTN